MNNLIKILIIIFQIGLTFIATFCLFMVYAMFDYKGGIANFIGLTVFQPIYAIIFSGLTIGICFLVGLPIRLNNRLNTWWRKHFYISTILIFIGLGLCVTSLTPSFIEEVTYSMEGVERTDIVPNQLLSITGWFVLAIGTLHQFPPLGLLQKIEKLIAKTT